MFGRKRRIQGVPLAAMPASSSGGRAPPLGGRDAPVARLRFRLGRIFVARECLRFGFVWIMLWAAAVVGVRAVFQVDRLIFLCGLPGLAVAGAVGALLAVRKLPSPLALRAALDRHARLGGLLMASGDTEVGYWQERLPAVPEPPLHWRPGRQVMLLAAAVAFLLAALLVPDRVLPSGARSLEIGGEIQKLAEKLQVLREEQVLAPERVEAVETDLERIRREALGNDPGKTMEAIDHLDRSFGQAAADAAEQVLRDSEAAGRVQELADALEAVGTQMDPRQFAEAMQELANMAEQAAAESERLAERLSEELQEALGQGELTEEQLKALAEALGDCRACQRAMLERLVEAQLIDPDVLILLAEADEFDPDALAEALLLCEDGEELAALLAALGMPGRGGINRGDAPPAAMIWQDPVASEGADFQEKILPPGAASLEESRLAGISAGDPTAAEWSGGSAGGALDAAPPGGGEAHTHVVLPQHEKAIQRYFTREPK